ncbi:MAG: amino acid ABC transporter permease [Firmicutes bacterium]|nr:amino acid ABC transporter permease [Bacillota bacterium]
MDFFSKFHEIFIVKNGISLVLNGLLNTLIIALSAIVIGIIIGIIMAAIKVAPISGSKPRRILIRVLKIIANVYVAIFRGTPIVVQLLVVYWVMLSPLRIPAMAIAIIVFGLNSGAYVTESVRGGILAVDAGQTEAGRSLGLSYTATMFKIVLPQAIKNIIPTLANELVALIKETSVAGMITVMDITYATQQIVAREFNVLVPYITLALIYLVIVLVATYLIKLLERRLRKGDKR